MEFKDLTYYDRFNQIKPHIIEAGKKVIQMRNDASFECHD